MYQLILFIWLGNMWLSTPQSSAVSVSSTLFKWILWKSRFANHSFNIYKSGGGTGSCNWNMASDICEANDFGLSARRVPEKIYLYPVDKNRQTTSRLWKHSGTCKRSLIAKLLKFTFKLLKYVFESYYCLLIYIDEWFCCMHRYRGASTSFMFKSYRQFFLHA